ncbi:glycosyl hydrolase family 95 catalytic domain-containing protein [Streptomyces sp. NPDC020917]|uniref:glycosyl hydrolase family 95 catalytic domain-containing protein n=1 Tax=Streptomyces sp. NPDC020917 TaxID=3365102 RepID=UPI00379F238B
MRAAVQCTHLRARPRRALGSTAVVAIVCATLTTALSGPALADQATPLSRPTSPGSTWNPSAMSSSATAGQAWRTVQQYAGEWSSPPSQLLNGETVDAPLVGNGDFGATVGGTIDNQTFYLGKNDFFSTPTNNNSVRPLGRVVLAVPGLAGSSYHVVQDIAHARIQGTYSLDGETLTATSWMSATENALVTSLRLSGSACQNAKITVENGSGGTPAVSGSSSVLDADVVADTSGMNNPQARMATTVVGGGSAISSNTLSLTLTPGTTSTIVTGFGASTETADWQGAADALVSSLTPADVSKLDRAHQAWWRRYWSKSYVEIPDKAVERSWYGSLYLLGSAEHGNSYSPGLWGPWITRNMNWNGGYFTNYNDEAAFYPGLSTNHIDQVSAFDQPVLDFVPAGLSRAASNGYKGVLFPVSLAPRGGTSANTYQAQKSDAVYMASTMVMHYEYTHDAKYAAKVYPFLKQVGLFWQDYLVKDSTGTYNDYNDASQENAPYPASNPNHVLGLIHLLMGGLIDMSGALGQDTSLVPTWNDINTHLAPLPTMARNNQTVFRETSEGLGWVDDGNDVALQAVYPGLRVGLDSPADLQQTARNTIGQLARWHDYNAPATFYAAAAMVGYNPDTIMANLHQEATTYSYNNLAVHHGGGGLENLNVTTSGLDEMLLQSHQDDIKVFADWPSNTSAKFGDLRAWGGFLISSSISNNKVQYIRAESQAGGSFTFTNPWPGQKVEVYRNGKDTGTVSGSKITIPTSRHHTLELAPAGTALKTIRTKLAEPLHVTPISSFSTGFESTDPAPDWADAVDTTGGGLAGVTGICCGLTGPQNSTRNETSHTGSGALMYSGSGQGGSAVHAFMKTFDLAGRPLAIGTGTTLSYWIYPQSNATTTWVPADSINSTCVAVDMVFTDGSPLRDSGAVDQNGNSISPAQQCGHLTLDTWNHVTVNLGASNAGKQISRLLIGYDNPNSTGGYRGYVDDLTIG